MKWKQSGCFVAAFLLFFLLFADRDKGVYAMGQDIRKAELAGTWYPGNPERLKAEILRFLGQVPREKVEGKLVALISPHAGIVYSGQVAAFGYRLIEGEKFDSVIVIGPSHRFRFRGVSVYDRGGFETPLGLAPVDTELAGKIMARDKAIAFRPEAFVQENSIEIQIPFLQTVLGQFKFVPIAMGTQDKATCRMLAEAILQSVGERKVLIVASTDLSHYYRYERATAMDTELIDKIARMDVDAFLDALESGRGEACGGGAVAVAMMVGMNQGPVKAKILKYANSGDVTGDKSGVVGYLSCALYLPAGREKEEREPRSGVNLGLSAEEKKALLGVARRSIEARLNGKDLPPAEIDTERFREKRGAFVTLKKNARLRGCIGFIEGRKPLLRTVQEMAQAAAFEDPRFYPVTEEELKDLDIEISVLTPLRRIRDVNEIEVGKHGIYIVKGYRSGLLLPQVATEYGWDRITFLNETCRKAGLKPEDWKEKDTDIFIFSADIFGEKEE